MARQTLLKSTLCLLMTLVCGVAWAEVTLPQVSTDGEMHFYRFKSLRSSKYAAYAGNAATMQQTTVNTLNTIWYITTDGEGYKLHNAATDMLYASHNSFTATGVTVYIGEHPYNAGYLCVSTNANRTSGCWDAQNNGNYIGSHRPSDSDYQGTSWTLEEVTDQVTTSDYTFTLSEATSGIVYTGSYTCYEYNGNNSLPACLTADGVEYSNAAWDNQTFTADITFPFPVSSAEVTNPTMIVSGSSWSTTARKWRVVTDSEVDYVKVQTAAVTPAEVSQWLWAIYPELTNGAFTFKIKSIAKGTYVYADPDSDGDVTNDVTGNTKPVRLAQEGTPFTYAVRTGTNCQFTYKNSSGTSLALSIASSSNANAFLGVYSESHNGNDICTADPITNTNFGFPVSTTGNEQGVFISPFKNSDIKYYVNGTDVKATKNAANNENFVWAIYPSFGANGLTLTIKNIGTGKYIYTESTELNHKQGLVIVSETATNFTLGADNMFKTGRKSGNKDLYLSTSSSTSSDQFAGTWENSSHQGTRNTIATAIGENTYTLTDAIGNVYTGTYNGYVGISEPTFTGVEYTLTNQVWNGNAFTANIEFSGLPFPLSKTGEEDWTFIRSYAMTDGKCYFHVDNDYTKVITRSPIAANGMTYLPTVDNIAKWQWAIYPAIEDGKIVFTIKNKAANKFVGGTGAVNPAPLADEGSKFGWGACVGNGKGFSLVNNTNVFFAANSSKAEDQNAILWNKGNNNIHQGGNLEFFATSYTITTDANGYATLYTPIAVTIPDGVTVYKGNMVTANKASLIVGEVENITVIPANTAVIIKGTPSTKYTFSKSNEAGTAIEGNVLMGSANSVATNSIQDGVPYTLQADGTFTKHTAESIPGYNVYIKLPTGTTNPVNILGEEGFVGGVEDFVQGGVYTFVSSKGWMGATETCDNVISTAKTAHNVTGTAADDMFQWTVYKSNNANYYLYNIGKRMFMGVQSSNNASVPFANSPAGKKLTFKNSNVAGYPIMFSTDNAAVVNHNGSYGDGCISWTGGWNNLNDEGSNHQVTFVDKLTEANLTTIAEAVETYEAELKRLAIEALETAITTAQPKRNGMGGGLGYYSSTDVNATTTFDAIVEFKNSITDETTINTIEGHTKTVNELFTLNVPQPGKFYRLKGISGNYIDATSIYNNANATSGQMSMKAEANANLAGTIFYLDEEKHFLNYATGTYVNQTREIGTVGNANKGVWSFNASPRTLGTLALSCTTTGNAGQNLHDNGGTRADRCDRNCGDRHDWTVEEVTTLPVTISAASVNFNGATKCVSTLFTPVALEVPVGITAYIGVNEDNYLAMEPIEAEKGAEKAIIPAGTGVILMADAAGTYNFTISAETDTAIEPGANIITGTVAKTIITPAAINPEANTTCYVLAKKDEKVGLYKATLNKNGGQGFLNNAFKAYVPVEGAQDANAPALVMRFGRGQGTTEIELPTANGQQPTAVYDLQGRRVLNPTKGMYIINGKKVVIR